MPPSFPGIDAHFQSQLLRKLDERDVIVPCYYTWMYLEIVFTSNIQALWRRRLNPWLKFEASLGPVGNQEVEAERFRTLRDLGAVVGDPTESRKNAPMTPMEYDRTAATVTGMWRSKPIFSTLLPNVERFGMNHHPQY